MKQLVSTSDVIRIVKATVNVRWFVQQAKVTANWKANIQLPEHWCPQGSTFRVRVEAWGWKLGLKVRVPSGGIARCIGWTLEITSWQTVNPAWLALQVGPNASILFVAVVVRWLPLLFIVETCWLHQVLRCAVWLPQGSVPMTLSPMVTDLHLPQMIVDVCQSTHGGDQCNESDNDDKTVSMGCLPQLWGALVSTHSWCSDTDRTKAVGDTNAHDQDAPKSQNSTDTTRAKNEGSILVHRHSAQLPAKEWMHMEFDLLKFSSNFVPWPCFASATWCWSQPNKFFFWFSSIGSLFSFSMLVSEQFSSFTACCETNIEKQNHVPIGPICFEINGLSPTCVFSLVTRWVVLNLHFTSVCFQCCSFFLLWVPQLCEIWDRDSPACRAACMWDTWQRSWVMWDARMLQQKTLVRATFFRHASLPPLSRAASHLRSPQKISLQLHVLWWNKFQSMGSWSGRPCRSAAIWKCRRLSLEFSFFVMRMSGTLWSCRGEHKWGCGRSWWRKRSCAQTRDHVSCKEHQDWQRRSMCFWQGGAFGQFELWAWNIFAMGQSANAQNHKSHRMHKDSIDHFDSSDCAQNLRAWNSILGIWNSAHLQQKNCFFMLLWCNQTAKKTDWLPTWALPWTDGDPNDSQSGCFLSSLSALISGLN